MNGETRLVLDRLQAIETKQEERHKENLIRMAKLDKIPCETHDERLKGVQRSIAWFWGLLSGAIIITIGIFVKHLLN